MKTVRKLSLMTAALLAGSVSLNSCDALWDADISYNYPYYYGNGYYGWDGEWLPTLAGAPLISPYYYGGSAFPVGNYRPVYRPGDNPWGGPVNVRPPRPVTGPGNSIGNIRPGQGAGNSNNGRPGLLRPAPGASTFPNIKGSNPGIQLPPAGSGFKWTPQTSKK